MSAIRRLLLGGLVLAPLAACGPTIRSDRDETIPVPQGATWAWAAPDSGERAARGRSPSGEIVEQRFRRAIEAAMLAKGYRQIADGSQADFALSARFGEPTPSAARRTAGVAVAVSTGWGYRPWGFGRFSLYRPWGFYEPWGLYQPWGFYRPWGWGFYGAPVWGGYVGPASVPGRRLYSDRALVVVLRHRATGEVAWSGRLGSDALGSHRLSQERVQELTTRLFATLR